MDESGRHHWYIKTCIERQRLYDLTYMWNLKEMNFKTMRVESTGGWGSKSRQLLLEATTFQLEKRNKF